MLWAIERDRCVAVAVSNISPWLLMDDGIWLVEPWKAERRVCPARKGGYVIRYVGISLLLDSVWYYLCLFWTFFAGVSGCRLVDRGICTRGLPLFGEGKRGCLTPAWVLASTDLRSQPPALDVFTSKHM